MSVVQSTGRELRRGTRPLVRAAFVGLLCVTPLVLNLVMLQYFWERGELGIDFTQTLLPAAQEIVDGDSPYPAYGYPPLVAFALIPFTALPSPELVHTALLLIGIAASLRILEIRDWRCYGAAFLWGASFHAVQTGNVTVWLLVLTALAWRHRDSARRVGAWAGLATATKIVCWPLVVWLAATRRTASALLAILVAAGTTLVLWAMLGFSGLIGYPSSLDRLESAQAPSSYTVRALAEDLGAPTIVGQALWAAIVLGTLAACVVAGRRRADATSFAFAVLAAIVASPIVWLHSFVLLLAPVAVLRPRFGWAWIVPALLWFGSGTGNGSSWQTAMVLGVGALTFVLALAGTRAPFGDKTRGEVVSLPTGR